MGSGCQEPGWHLQDGLWPVPLQSEAQTECLPPEPGDSFDVGGVGISCVDCSAGLNRELGGVEGSAPGFSHPRVKAEACLSISHCICIVSFPGPPVERVCLDSYGIKMLNYQEEFGQRRYRCTEQTGPR